MNSKTKHIASKSLLAFVLLLYLFSLYRRQPHIDDAWIGEQVYWLNEKGKPLNVLMRNHKQNEKKLLVYHKLWVWQGWLAVKLFGFSLYVLKSVSLLYFIALTLILWFYTVKKKKLLRNHEFIIPAALFLMHPLIFRYSFVFRPEIALAAIGMVVFILMEDYVNGSKKPAGKPVVAGLLSGIAVLIHLNGLVYVITVGILLLAYRQFKGFAIYALAVLPVVSIYFVDIATKNDWMLWRNQMTFFAETGKEGFSIKGLLVSAFQKLFDEHLRWFHSPPEIAWSMVFILVVVRGFYTLRKKTPVLLYFTLTASLVLAFIGINKTVKYLILLLPFYFILTVVYFKSLPEEYTLTSFFSIRKKYLITRIVLLLAVFTGLVYDLQIAVHKFTPQKYRDFSENYIHPDAEKTIILAPMQFIYDELGNYRYIAGLFSYQERLKPKGLSKQNFFSTARADSVDFILINRYNKNLFHIPELRPGDTVEGYGVVTVKYRLTLLKRLKDKHPEKN